MGAHSTIPAILTVLAISLLALMVHALRKRQIGPGELAALAAWIAALAVWGAVSAWFSLNGIYDAQAFLTLIPGLWVPLVPIAITAAFALFPAFRRGLTALVHHHARFIIFVQSIRVTALGGVAKGFAGLLPASFALPVGIPDFLFGLAGAWLALAWPKGGWSTRTLVIWNALGIAAIVPAAPILMQMGLPGPFYTFSGMPDARVLFDYPMVMAPTLLVPFFVTINAVHIFVLWRQRRDTTHLGDTGYPK